MEEELVQVCHKCATVWAELDVESKWSYVTTPLVQMMKMLLFSLKCLSGENLGAGVSNSSP